MSTERETAPTPARVRDRVGWTLWRLARHEWTLVVLGSLLLAAVLTWPTLRDLTGTIPQDTGDPTLQAWQVAWGGHALLSDPGNLWHSNTFHPEPYTYAYSDTLLGYAPFGMVGDGPVAAVVRYNLLYVLVHALAFVGAYALARQVGAGRAGSAVAGAAFAYAPWKLAQAGHLHVLSVGGIALSLAMLARGHGWSLRHGYRPERVRPGWAAAGWLVAAWQISLGFGIGLPFAYVLALVCLAAAVRYAWSAWRRARPPFPRGLLLADLAGGVFFAGVALLMAAPYFEVVERHPEGRRTVEHIAMFSPPLRGFLTAPPENWLWGERHAAAREALGFPGEMTLLPGVVLLGLAFSGLFLSAWRLRHRLVLLAGVLVSVALASGTAFLGDGDPGYATLVEHAPGWDGIRTPGRLVLWSTLLLGILAAGALTREPSGGGPGAEEPTGRADRSAPDAPTGAEPSVPDAPAGGRFARWGRLVLVVPLALVLLEGVNRTPHVPVPEQPAALRGVSGPLLVLPSDGIRELHVMLWSTDGFPRMVNGLASFTPASQAETRAASLSFPDASSVAYLRQRGIRTVVLLPGYAAGTPWQDAASRPVDGLGIRREQIGDGFVYHLG
ncbi:hypothetical protein [Micromonospora sagamiensis]|uniref:4-amino-4-deoxy-L-arabinose transferase-like glycosyltransferase n=1 Tax=Micromonospora sagamiensis TaxID=47875 RepID=A0A562WCF8_9ACTN|nr:hypothetical protein [Micromonospora sagamiensis]TWJ27886.1 hypothetical protein JD81_01386 [Micromonospora sagamiensis]BCL13224.1 hypothetical protein GCM10017556_09630 [Micromonospora sagamiensis]